VQRPEVALSPVTRVISQDLMDVAYLGRCDLYVHRDDHVRRTGAATESGQLRCPEWQLSVLRGISFGES
jgi:hypothetical protein